MKKRWTIGLVTVCGTGIALIAVTVGIAGAQSEICSAGSPQPSSVLIAQSGAIRTPGIPFEAQLWQYLRDARYQNWAPVPGTSGDFTEGHSPHGAFVKTYINRTAAADLKKPGLGSILVKENFGKDKQSLMAITVMYRTKGYDPEHNDWYWVKYEADGRVSEMNQMKVAGKLMMCIDCHNQAKGGDFIFGNDGP